MKQSIKTANLMDISGTKQATAKVASKVGNIESVITTASFWNHVCGL